MTAEYEVFDLAVIGAGVNGAGIARDAAMRGLKVALIDKGDVASGTSWISSRLVHGGLRYLEYGEIALVHESLRERRTLRHIAAHLVEPLRITIPIYASGRRSAWLIRLGMIAYDILSWTKAMPGHDMLSREEMLEVSPGIAADGLRGGARYYDAQVTFAERLVLENALAAAASGSTVLTYHEATGFETSGGRVTGVVVNDTLTNECRTLAVRSVVNAAGPWVDEVIREASGGQRRLIGGTKGSHIVVPPFEGAIDEALYVEAAADGRPIFILPWNGLYLIGTTDIRYSGSLDHVRASRGELDYLLNETNRVFPNASLAVADICYAYAGIRPLPHREEGPESAITRSHSIVANTDIASNLVSIVGGKLTTYRSLAEEAVDGVLRLLKRPPQKCQTAAVPLPGAKTATQASALESLTSLSSAGRERIRRVYGSRAGRIAELATDEPELDRALDDAGRVSAAEIVFVIRNERPRMLVDIVFRRTMLGLDADQARPLYEQVAAIAAAEWNWSADELSQQLAALERYGESLRPGAAE